MTPTTRVTARQRPLASGPGRLLIAVYGIFALAATSRAGVQIATTRRTAPASRPSRWRSEVGLKGAVAWAGFCP